MAVNPAMSSPSMTNGYAKATSDSVHCAAVFGRVQQLQARRTKHKGQVAKGQVAVEPIESSGSVPILSDQQAQPVLARLG